MGNKRMLLFVIRLGSLQELAPLEMERKTENDIIKVTGKRAGTHLWKLRIVSAVREKRSLGYCSPGSRNIASVSCKVPL